MNSARPGHARVLKWLLNAILAGFVFLALMFLAVWLTWHSRFGVLLDYFVGRHMPKGSVMHPTQAGVDAFIARLPFAAWFFAICAVSLALLKGKLEEFLSAVPQEWHGIREVVREQFSPGNQIWMEFAAALTIFAVGVFLRLWHVGRAIRYDEAATYLNFVSKPFYRALSNYSYPNNHLLHTLLARLSILTLGDTTLALRLPALVAGCLTIPLAWLTGRVLYNRDAGVLAAGLVAALPTFIEFSVNARGYSLQWDFLLLMMCCSAWLVAKPGLKTVWVAFVVAGLAGIYCIPTMVIPMGALVIWMLLSEFVTGGVQGCKELLINLVRAGFAMGLLSVLLYIPPLLASGPAAVISNRFVAPREGSFLGGLGLLARAAWVRWSDGVPLMAVYIVIGGIALGLVFHSRVATHRVPMTVVLWIFTFCFAWARNILGFPRVWSYLLLAAVITSSAGLSLVIRTFIRPPLRLAVVSVISVGLALLIGTSLIQQRTLFQSNETAALIDVSQVIEFLRANIRPGDALAVGHPAGPIVEYELLRQDPRLYSSLAAVENAHHVVVVLPKPELDSDSYGTEELLARLKARDAVDPSLASSQIELDQFSPPQLLAKFQSVTIYAFDRK
jgi:hypothetical protein